MKRFRGRSAQRWKKRGCGRLGGFEIRTDGTQIGFAKSNLVIVLSFDCEGPDQLLRLLEKLGAHMRDFFIDSLHRYTRGDHAWQIVLQKSAENPARQHDDQ